MVTRAIVPSSEGRIPFNVPEAEMTATTWYKIIGNLSQTAEAPLIALHGGPGAGHEYLSSLIDLYHEHSIPIVFYDQIGCGKSTHFRERMGDESFWTIDLFVRELDNLIDALELREGGFHILGQSWGGVLAGSYATGQPIGLRRVVIASGPSSIPLYVEGVQQLFRALPEDVRKTLEECERRGDHESEEYERASSVWSKRHVCRMDPFPKPLQATMANLKDDPTAYMTMQGPSEFQVVGSLRDWEGWSKAHNIRAATLLINGRYDEAQDVCIKPWFKKIPKVKWVMFENSSHMAHWEERKRYIQVVGDFLME
ncbi:Alpha/Beta hydrolase protein [Massariosphaeria phaeospora]|uniref:Alpha/Beta hydrolase protein n=1 Tax=Massariosphaeria phaeospora TaxID=100035 RepID=A0A7C8MPK8_9PLEO|nr:Alpha/Beta hydrolase protein [Massariosphaeria phaeospora]